MEKHFPKIIVGMLLLVAISLLLISGVVIPVDHTSSQQAAAGITETVTAQVNIHSFARHLLDLMR